MLIIFLCFLATVFAVVKAFLSDYVPLIFLCVFLVFNLIVFIVSFFKKDVFKRFFEVLGIKSLKTFCIIVLTTILVSSLVSSINFLHYSKREVKNGMHYVSATVSEVVELDESSSLLLKNVEIDGKTYSFNIQAGVDGGDFEVGDRLDFSAYLYAVKLVYNGEINTKSLKINVQYACDIDSSLIAKSSGRAYLTDVLKDNTKTLLFENMSKENAGLAYAIISGDKSLLSETYYEIFVESGLSHVLAVSGLHIAVLVAMIVFILKKLKVKPKVRFIAVGIILLIYNVLCNFSPSVFRASVMSLCLMLGSILGERNDMLSNLSLAGVIVLMFQPLFLFDVGFLLSFGSVFGIFLLSKKIQTLLEKIKIPKTIAAAVAVTISATLGTFPWMCKYFHRFAPIAILSNLIVLPIFEIMFVVVLLTVVFNLMFPLSFLFPIAEFFVSTVVSWSYLFANFGMIRLFDFDTISAIIYYFVMFVISPYFILNFKAKVLCVLSIMLCFSTTLANCNSKTIINFDSISITNTTNSNLLLTTKTGKTILSSVDASTLNSRKTDDMISKKKIFEIDYLLIFNYGDNYESEVLSVTKKYNVKNLIVFGDLLNSTKIGLVDSLKSSEIIEFVSDYNYRLEGEEFFVNIYQNENKTKAVRFDSQNYKVLQVLYSINLNEIQNNAIFDEHFDCLIASRFVDRYTQIEADRYIAKRVYGTDENVCVMEDLWTILI